MLKSYFGYDNTWTNNGTSYGITSWQNSDETITCEGNEKRFSCYDSYVGAYAFDTDENEDESGHISTHDEPNYFECRVYPSGEDNIYCDYQ